MPDVPDAIIARRPVDMTHHARPHPHEHRHRRVPRRRDTRRLLCSRAIDKAASTPSGGILFVPPGRCRLTRTLYVERSVRLIGVGATRPVFVLADNTSGYQKGIGLIPESTLATKKTVPRAAGSAPNLRWNQFAANACAMNPPPNASSAKRVDSHLR